MHAHHNESEGRRDWRPTHEGHGKGGWGHRPANHNHGHHGFRGGRPHLETIKERPDFGYTSEEGEDTMQGNGRGWRGGHTRGHGRHDFGFGRGPGRPERPLVQGDLRWLVLHLIAAQPRHGYEIIKAIEELMHGHYTPSPGVIYPTLTYLEETNVISSEAQGSKKLYSITEEGAKSLEENAEAVRAVRERIGETRARFGAPPAPEMMRAMDNLRAAIQVRLSKGELSDESLAKITAALDRAAGEIERS